MKILFIAHAPGGQVRQGILYLSALLKKNNYSVTYLNTANHQEVDNYIREYNPDLLAYSCTSGEYRVYNELNRRLKHHGIFSVIGGSHATFFGQEFMQNEDNSFDGACRGEGEGALLELCDRLREGKDYQDIKNWIFRDKSDPSLLIVNPPRPLIEDLDNLPFPDYHLYKDAKQKEELPEVPIWLHRGCPYDCTYCLNHKWRALYKGLGKTIRVASPRYCIDMIKNMLLSVGYRPKYLLFDDDTFGHDLDWLKTFCKLLKEEVGIPWVMHLYPTMINEERVSIMAEGGCYGIRTAIETGNEQRRKELLKRPMTNQQIERAAKIVHDKGLIFFIQNILLLPGETLETALETFELNVRCRPQVSTASKFQPYPGIELTEKAIEMGLLERGKFENSIPDNFHWISILKFPDRREFERMNNLLHLFTFGVAFSFLKPLVYLLIRLPTSKLHYHIDNISWKVIAHGNPDRSKFTKFISLIWNFILPTNILKTFRRKITYNMVIEEDVAARLN